MGGMKETESKYTVETMKLAIELSKCERREQILKLLASAVYGTHSRVKPMDLLHCLADVLGGHYPKQLEELIEGRQEESP